MTIVNPILDRLDDLVNPIIVKELRQVVRGKFFWSVLLLFLGFQCVVLSLSIADKGLTSRSVGGETLTFLFGILFFASFVLIPLFNGFKFAREQNEGSDELLFITTITPETIIRGKFSAGMVFIFLIYSAFSPFMAMTFFLSGVDLPMTFLAMLIGILFSAVGVMTQIFFATLSRDAHSQQFFRGFGLFIQVVTFFSIAGAGAEMGRFGSGHFLGYSDRPQSFLTILICTCAVIYILYKASAAVIAPAGSNRMLPVRICASQVWFVSLLVVTYWAFSAATARFYIVWGAFVCSALVIATMVAISERDFVSERVAREIPENPLKKRLAFVFFSGAAGGLVWVVFTIMKTLIVIQGVSMISGMSYSSDLGEVSIALLAFMGYCLGYGLLASFIRRIFFANYVDVRNTWAYMLLVTAMAAVLPLFLGVFVGSNSDLLMLGNPLAMLDRSKPEGLLFGLAIFAFGLVINFPWLRRQTKEFMAAGKSHAEPL